MRLLQCRALKSLSMEVYMRHHSPLVEQSPDSDPDLEDVGPSRLRIDHTPRRRDMLRQWGAHVVQVECQFEFLYRLEPCDAASWGLVEILNQSEETGLRVRFGLGPNRDWVDRKLVPSLPPMKRLSIEELKTEGKLRALQQSQASYVAMIQSRAGSGLKLDVRVDSINIVFSRFTLHPAQPLMLRKQKIPELKYIFAGITFVMPIP
ncbi:hypothetical protein B0H16DRAFT_1472702 [Mycena metata]|uniref:Uncharacterized protein n=1 Tax=Mycena metata TaxID=1033252 RepID=A0AAD7HM82_9AGAR|nr:hypothetical protein B0H16DRAFT_1472702 [Mycena metata]